VEMSITICMLVSKLHVLFRNCRGGWYDVVNFTGLFTHVTHGCIAATAMVHLRHWHVELDRLRLLEFLLS
jgi:hypothetical protein